jgi:ComF family protein
MLLQSRCAGCDRIGEVLCRTCRFALVGAAPRLAAPHAGVGGRGDVITALAFSGRARDVILGFKYRNRRQLAGHLAGLLVNRLVAAGIRPGHDVDVVTWAPTSTRRRRQRGFDQAELVARRVAAQLGVPCRRLLERHGPDVAQTGLSRTDRLHGPAFRVRPDVDGRRVLVIDDVVTTGSTLQSATAALQEAGAATVVRAAIAATPGGRSARSHRWGQVVTGPWAGSGDHPHRRTA